MEQAESGARRPWWRRKAFLWPAGALAAVVVVLIAVLVVFTSSPTPGTLVIRKVFNAEGAKTKAAMEKHTVPGVHVTADQRYRASDPAARLDVYAPAGTRTALPTVVWTHGGAWISGDKRDAAPYFTRSVAPDGGEAEAPRRAGHAKIVSTTARLANSTPTIRPPIASAGPAALRSV